MKKLIIGAILMILPILMLGQESVEESLRKGADGRAEAKHAWLRTHPERTWREWNWNSYWVVDDSPGRARAEAGARITGEMVYDWLDRKIKSSRVAPPPGRQENADTRYEMDRALDEMKRELRWEAMRLQFEMEEELRQTILIDRLFRDIYRPRRIFYNFTIMEPFKPWRFVTVWDNNR